MIYYVLILIWLLLGVWGFICWWTRDLDFTISNIPTLIIASTLGPLIFILWALSHEDFADKVLFRRNIKNKRSGGKK